MRSLRPLAGSVVVSIAALAACRPEPPPGPPSAGTSTPPPTPTAHADLDAGDTAPAVPADGGDEAAGPSDEAATRTPVPPDMLPVPGGRFTMGADDEGEQDERPAHEVEIDGFLLDKTEVTNRAYVECVDASVCKMYKPLLNNRLMNGRPDIFHRPDHPVVGVSWFDATQYCQWREKRLPTEAEWERAARDDDGRRFVWGDDPPDRERHGAFLGRLTTAPVGSFPDGSGPYGHLDLAGNVWEWVADEYDPFAYKRDTAGRGIPGSCEQILETQDYLRRHKLQGYTGTNPIPTECERVLRGGAFNYHANGLRASNRVHHPARFRIAVAGFRCARDLVP